MSKKQMILQAVKIAGYHNDTKTGTRLFIENRISRADYDSAFHAGIAAKNAGAVCNCAACKSGAVKND